MSAFDDMNRLELRSNILAGHREPALSLFFFLHAPLINLALSIPNHVRMSSLSLPTSINPIDNNIPSSTPVCFLIILLSS
jgi:hypothetical protein